MVGVSVIIPTYGEPVYLHKAIYSVLNQTYHEIQLIIVDDNDPISKARTETEAVVTEAQNRDSRVVYLKHPQNLNGAVARNTGISQATGKYIAFLDSDDEYLPDRLQKCVDLMERAPSHVAGVYTGCEFRRNGHPYYTHKNVKAGNYLLDTLACTFMFCTGSNIFARKSVVDELNGFDSAFLRHQDYEFLVRVFEKYSIEAIPEVLVIKNNENVNLPKVEKIIAIKKQFLDKFDADIKACTKSEQEYIYHSHYLQIAEIAQKTKRNAIASEYYRKVKEQGGLSLKERLRRVAFILRNLA